MMLLGEVIFLISLLKHNAGNPVELQAVKTYMSCSETYKLVSGEKTEDGQTMWCSLMVQCPHGFKPTAEGKGEDTQLRCDKVTR